MKNRKKNDMKELSKFELVQVYGGQNSVTWNSNAAVKIVNTVPTDPAKRPKKRLSL